MIDPTVPQHPEQQPEYPTPPEPIRSPSGPPPHDGDRDPGQAGGPSRAPQEGWVRSHRTAFAVAAAVVLVGAAGGTSYAVASSSSPSSAAPAATSSAAAPTTTGKHGSKDQAGHPVKGVISAENGSTWTITTTYGRAVTVSITPETSFGSSSAAAFPQGSTAVVKGTRSGETVTATSVATAPSAPA